MLNYQPGCPFLAWRMRPQENFTNTDLYASLAQTLPDDVLLCTTINNNCFTVNDSTNTGNRDNHG